MILFFIAICRERSKLTPHDGNYDTGDTIEFLVSPACSSNFSIFVDAYQETLYVYLHKTLIGSQPRGRLYGPDGKTKKTNLSAEGGGPKVGPEGKDQHPSWQGGAGSTRRLKG